MNAITRPPVTPPQERIPAARVWTLIVRRCLWDHECEMTLDERFFFRTTLALGRISPAQWHRLLAVANRVMPWEAAETLRIAGGEA
jgi:hypothetical protein